MTPPRRPRRRPSATRHRLVSRSGRRRSGRCRRRSTRGSPSGRGTPPPRRRRSVDGPPARPAGSRGLRQRDRRDRFGERPGHLGEVADRRIALATTGAPPRPACPPNTQACRWRGASVGWSAAIARRRPAPPGGAPGRSPGAGRRDRPRRRSGRCSGRPGPTSSPGRRRRSARRARPTIRSRAAFSLTGWSSSLASRSSDGNASTPSRWWAAWMTARIPGRSGAARGSGGRPGRGPRSAVSMSSSSRRHIARIVSGAVASRPIGQWRTARCRCRGPARSRSSA